MRNLVRLKASFFAALHAANFSAAPLMAALLCATRMIVALKSASG